MALKAALYRAVKEEVGQGMVEYGLILALIAIGAVVALSFMGGQIKELFNEAGNSLKAAATPTATVAAGGGS
jgi:pilus assembly protein Flp/PilA